MAKVPADLVEPSGAVWDLKKPSDSHQSYHAASTACGLNLYPTAIGRDMSGVRERASGEMGERQTFLVSLGRRVHEGRLLHLFLLGLFLARSERGGLVELCREFFLFFGPFPSFLAG
jgi:hypothetical protein